MPPSPDSLRSQYTERNDSALLQFAAERDMLTPEAQAVLLDVLQQRGLQAPALLDRTEAPVEDAPTWVTVDRFRDLSIAIVARGALEAAGISCFLRDENTVRLDWQISNFIGGMRLQVRAQDESAAQQVLAELTSVGDPALPHEKGKLEPEEHCPFCGNTDVRRVERGFGLRVAVLWMFSLPLPRGARVWKCAHCGRDFPERDLLLIPER